QHLLVLFADSVRECRRGESKRSAGGRAEPLPAREAVFDRGAQWRALHQWFTPNSVEANNAQAALPRVAERLAPLFFNWPPSISRSSAVGIRVITERYNSS